MYNFIFRCKFPDLTSVMHIRIIQDQISVLHDEILESNWCVTFFLIPRVSGVR